MSRLKTFGKYILMIVGFYIFSTILSIGFISTTYNEMEENPQIGGCCGEILVDSFLFVFILGIKCIKSITSSISSIL